MTLDPNKIQILSIPSSIMWSIQLGSLRRYRLFNTHYLYHDKVFGHQARRFLMGIAASVLAPSILIYVSQFILDKFDGIGLLIASQVYSMSFFGITRILHAFLFSTCLCRYFYNDDEFKEMSSKSEFGDSNFNKFYYHFMPGFAYIFVFIGLVFIVSRFQ